MSVTINVGDVIKDITIIDVKREAKQHTMYKVRCNVCGKERFISRQSVLAGKGMLHAYNCDPPRLNIGAVYDDMLCVKQSPRPHQRQTFTMRCTKCGREKDMSAYHVLAHEGTTHMACTQNMDHINRDLYKKWEAMRCRTNRAPGTKSHKCYEDNNISSDAFTVYADFQDAMEASFLEHVSKYGLRNTTLDRIDSTKDYTPENCRWATFMEQSDNTNRVRTIRALSPTGDIFEARNIAAFCREHDLEPANVNKVLNGSREHHKGWKFEYIDLE